VLFLDKGDMNGGMGGGGGKSEKEREVIPLLVYGCHAYE
jgi:hypothetical protein